MFRIHKKSQLVTIMPNELSVVSYERMLRSEGYTGGYRSVAGMQKTMAECLRERLPNYYFLQYGGIENLCVGGKAILDDGSEMILKTCPRSATGPDFRRTLIGTHGKIGNFQEAVMRIFPIPQKEIWALALLEGKMKPSALIRFLLTLRYAPQFVRSLDPRDSKGLLFSLNISRTPSSLVVFKFSGLEALIRSQKETLTRTYEGQKLFFYWPLKTEENEILEQTLLTPQSYYEMIQEDSLLLGGHTDTRELSIEKKFFKGMAEG